MGPMGPKGDKGMKGKSKNAEEFFLNFTKDFSNQRTNGPVLLNWDLTQCYLISKLFFSC